VQGLGYRVQGGGVPVLPSDRARSRTSHTFLGLRVEGVGCRVQGVRV